MARELIRDWGLLARCKFELNGKVYHFGGSRKWSVCLKNESDTLWLHRTAVENLLVTGDLKIVEAPAA